MGWGQLWVVKACKIPHKNELLFFWGDVAVLVISQEFG